MPTIFVGANTVIDNMIVNNVSFENNTGKPMPLFENNGTIKHFTASNLHTDGDEVLINNGFIG